MTTGARTAARRPILTGLLGGALLLSGCAALTDADEAGNGSFAVVAAFYPLQYAAERVVGDLGSVENLTAPGGEPHDLSLSVAQTAEVADASLVVYLAGFQSAVDDAVEQSATGDAFDVATVVDLQPATDDHAHEDEDAHAAEEDDQAEGDDHGELGDLDPHFWLDPLRMADLGDALAERLAEIDPEHADDFAGNAQRLRADLEALDAAYVDGLASCERSTIVVSHDAFGYLSRYGLEVEGIVGLSPDAEPDPKVRAHLQELIDDDGITTVFSETLVDPEIAESLAQDTGVKAAVLDPIEGLSDVTADQDYLGLMEQSLVALEAANGCGAA